MDENLLGTDRLQLSADAPGHTAARWGRDRLVPTAGSMDHYTRLVRRVLGSPVALVSVIDGGEQLLPGASGLEEELDRERRTPVSHSLCRLVVSEGVPLIVTDARVDSRLADEPAVTETGVVAYAGFPLRDAAGAVVGSLCAVAGEPRDWLADDLATLHDLALACSAEMQRHQAQAAASESLTRALLDRVGVAIVFYDAEGRLVLANEQAQLAATVAGLELDAPPYAGAHVRRADNRTPVPPEEQLLPRALRGDEEDFEMVWFGEFGSERAVAGRSHRLLHPDGTLQGTIVSAQDVTELARALQVKESFVSTVSHELRTPLTAVIGYAELLADEIDAMAGDTTQAREILAVVERRALDLQARIGDLLDMTDLRRSLVLASVDVSDLARKVVSTVTDPAFAAGLSVDLRTGGPEVAQLDAGRVTQVVENLLSNAVKYTDEGGSITVTVSGTPDLVVIEVADDGAGMTRTDADQAFDRFWRSASAHEAAVPGIGIGLSLVHDIVSAHHGTVRLDSAPGEGTTVRVELPRSPAALT